MATGDRGSDLTGRLLGGRYRVTGQLGRGGMGVVCRAVDEVLGREVAVKVLRAFTDASAGELADLRARMRREARAAARIRHSGVVTVHDVADEAGLPVIVMELVDGPSLDDVLDERGPLGPREAAAIGAEVLDALDAAHQVGVLHRDVKPGNILLDRTGRVVLTDFGIASMEAPDDGATTRLTRSGELIGSLDYLAPERAQGQEPGPASDVWALGMTLYAAVEGSSPFRRTSVWSTLTAIVTEPLPEPRRAGPLAPVLLALMAKDPAARPTAARARRMLEAIADGTAPLVPGPPVPGADRTPTAPDVRAGAVPPPGFGPAPGTEPVVARGGGDPAAGPAPARRRPGRGRLALAAAVAAVLLAGGGVTYALVGGDGGETVGAEPPGSPATTPEAGARSGGGAADGKPERGSTEATREGKPSPSHGEDREEDGGKGDEDGDGGSPAGGSDGSGEGTDSGGGSDDGGNGDGDGGTSSGGGTDPTTAPAPVCHGIGGGKHNCDVWRKSTSYTGSGEPVGVLNEGLNYFYCQADLGRRETYGKWTNVWWAKTDDDSGNTGVYVSVVYVKGGGNDQPVPGLPVC
ncbi:serine/threonine-protein kinase [Streptomyces sp. P1-3]|uniref:serine/threonine-protein kinase n=1 Tax=Streptomyces sp. P1-3 TaxID=3421658 RepID=UPI003D36619A